MQDYNPQTVPTDKELRKAAIEAHRQMEVIAKKIHDLQKELGALCDQVNRTYGFEDTSPGLEGDEAHQFSKRLRTELKHLIGSLTLLIEK